LSHPTQVRKCADVQIGFVKAISALLPELKIKPTFEVCEDRRISVQTTEHNIACHNAWSPSSSHDLKKITRQLGGSRQANRSLIGCRCRQRTQESSRGCRRRATLQIYRFTGYAAIGACVAVS